MHCLASRPLLATRSRGSIMHGVGLGFFPSRWLPARWLTAKNDIMEGLGLPQKG
jgi:hypothetical protein